MSIVYVEQNFLSPNILKKLQHNKNINKISVQKITDLSGIFLPTLLTAYRLRDEVLWSMAKTVLLILELEHVYSGMYRIIESNIKIH